MATLYGGCIYCGQIQMVEGPESLSADEVNKLATEQCSCEGARKHRERIRIIVTAQEDIGAMFDETMPEASEVMKECVVPLYDEKIKGITIKLPEGKQAKLTKVGKGIKIIHEAKQKTELLSE